MSKIDDHRKNIYFPDIEIIKHAEKMADKNNVSFGFVMTQAYAEKHGLKFDMDKYRKCSKRGAK